VRILDLTFALMARDYTGANVKSTALVPDRLLCGNDNLRGSARAS